MTVDPPSLQATREGTRQPPGDGPEIEVTQLARPGPPSRRPLATVKHTRVDTETRRTAIIGGKDRTVRSPCGIGLRTHIPNATSTGIRGRGAMAQIQIQAAAGSTETAGRSGGDYATKSGLGEETRPSSTPTATKDITSSLRVWTPSTH